MLTYVSGLNRFFIFFLCFLLVMSFGVHYNAMVVKKSLPISILTLNPLCPPTFSGWGNGAEMTGRPPPLIFLTPLSIVDLTRPIWSGGSYYCVSSSRRYKRFSPHNGAHFRAFQFTPRSNATTKVSINRLQKEASNVWTLDQLVSTSCKYLLRPLVSCWATRWKARQEK